MVGRCDLCGRRLTTTMDTAGRIPRGRCKVVSSTEGLVRLNFVQLHAPAGLLHRWLVKGSMQQAPLLE